MSFKVQDRMLELSRLRSLLRGTAPCRTFPVRSIWHLRHPCHTLPRMLLCLLCLQACLLCQQGLLHQWVIMVRAVSSLLCLTLEQLLQQQQLLREKQEFDAWRASRAQASIQPQPQITSEGPVPAETNVDLSQRSASVARARPEDQITSKAKTKRARSASTSRRCPSPKRDYPRGTCTATRPSQASPKKAEHTLTPAQDLEAFKADMTSMLSDMLQASLSKFASQFNPSSGGQGDTVPTQTVASEPTVDVASNDDDSPQRGQRTSPKGKLLILKGNLQIQRLQTYPYWII